MLDRYGSSLKIEEEKNNGSKGLFLWILIVSKRHVCMDTGNACTGRRVINWNAVFLFIYIINLLKN